MTKVRLSRAEKKPDESSNHWGDTAMGDDKSRAGPGRRKGADRRSGKDTRSEQEKRALGERRAEDRRSGVDRRDKGAASPPAGARDKR
jgi:hypothetical protein